MAELSRIRGADTEEQLLELQRAFLASEESRARPAARVQRVGERLRALPPPTRRRGSFRKLQPKSTRPPRPRGRATLGLVTARPRHSSPLSFEMW